MHLIGACEGAQNSGLWGSGTRRGTRDKQWEKASGIFAEHAPFRITFTLQWNFIDAMLCYAARHALLQVNVPHSVMPIMIFFIAPAKEKARLHACVESFHLLLQPYRKGGAVHVVSLVQNSR